LQTPSCAPTGASLTPLRHEANHRGPGRDNGARPTSSTSPVIEQTGPEAETPTIHIPIRLQRRSGRKLITTPEGSAVPALMPRRDDTLIKALVRAHRWRRQIESGGAKSITDLAEQEGVTAAFVCRLLPLTCLAPDIVEGILDGRQPKGLRLAEMLGNAPMAWQEQLRAFGICSP
jgi:hypothetical protein